MRFSDILTILMPQNKSAEIVDPMVPADKDLFETAQNEKDYLAMLLIYAITFNDWQIRKDKKKRGYNIGAILMNLQDEIVHHELNSITLQNDLSQHSEFRLIQNYLMKIESRHLGGYTIYTTLEPCAMCSGMMTAVRLSRLVFGQKDAKYGGTFKKLELETAGYKKYPIKTVVDQSQDIISKSLDQKFSYSRSHIIKFLFSAEVYELFSQAENLLTKHQVQHKSNSIFYNHIYKYLNNNKQNQFHNQDYPRIPRNPCSIKIKTV